ncbi:MAG: D-alanyl-D-alanine endopeptidase [Burkholderiaceae bacterium]|nr:D-alanyl-D-alanine endopeptidase [Burkholderiaceae bacterium]
MRGFSLKVLVVALATVVMLPAAHAARSQKAEPAAVGKKVSQAKKGRSMKAVADARKPRAMRAHLSGGKRKASIQRVAYASALAGVPPMLTAGDLAGLHLTRDPLDLNSSVALVLDQSTNEVLFEKNASVALPIASITKLMTSLVVVEANQDLDEMLTVTEEDVDREKFSHSRLRIGSQLSRANMLHIALMSSENRAASALGRHYPGGIRAFVGAMNAKAQELGMGSSHFADATGLSSANVSSARDLAKLVVAGYQHPLIRQFSTDSRYAVDPGGRTLEYRNSNGLIEKPDWEIGLQKTGYISEAGRCLVMQVHVSGRPVVMIFLDSKSKQSRLADASRIRKWLENRGASAMSERSAKRS